MDIFTLIAAVVILFLGRQIFWLFVAALGAVEGGQLALTYFANQPPWVQVAAVILGGVLGAVIGMFLQPLAAAIVGFYAGGAVEGGQIALTYFADRAPWVQVVAVVLGGVIGALIGMFLQPIAAAVVGFYAGGQVAQDLVMRWGLTVPTYAWLPFVIGGVIGAVLMLMIFNWALIILSSLYGATLIVQNTHFPPETQKILFLVLFVLGLVVQTGLYKRNPAAL